MAKGSQHRAKRNGNRKADLDVANVITAVNHPLRRQILREWKDEETSPRDLADRLGRPLSNVSYHVRVLANCCVLELVRTKQVRGSMQHFYVSNADKDEQLRGLLLAAAPQDERQATP